MAYRAGSAAARITMRLPDGAGSGTAMFSVADLP